MKWKEKETARTLRTKGESIKSIARKLGVAKSSVSVWVRDIVLSQEAKKKLNAHGHTIEAIEMRREKRIRNTFVFHRAIIEEAKKDISDLSAQELRLIGTALYWGEGGKTRTGMARIANSDPAVIQLMMRFFSEICGVSKERFRGHVHTFSHLNAKKAEEYWSGISGIPTRQFFKTYSKPSKAGSGNKDTTPYGTFQIYVCDTKVFLSIMGWIEKIIEISISKEQK